MRFQQQVGVIQRNNCHINGNNGNQVARGGTAIFYSNSSGGENENGNNFSSDEKCLKTLKSIIHESDSEQHTNNFDSSDVNRIERLLKFKTNSCGYFKNFIDTQQQQQQRDDINIDLNGNDNDNVLLIETLNLTEDNLSRVRAQIICFLDFESSAHKLGYNPI
jgi:hypothetical protein